MIPTFLEAPKDDDGGLHRDLRIIELLAGRRRTLKLLSAGCSSVLVAACGVVRSDIRASFIGSTTVAAGVNLALTLTLVNSNASCAALSVPASACASVYADSSTYPSSAANFAQIGSLSSDNVFGDNTAAQNAQMTPVLSGSAAVGYSGTATIGLAV